MGDTVSVRCPVCAEEFIWTKTRKEPFATCPVCECRFRAIYSTGGCPYFPPSKQQSSSVESKPPIPSATPRQPPSPPSVPDPILADAASRDVRGMTWCPKCAKHQPTYENYKAFIKDLDGWDVDVLCKVCDSVVSG